MSFSFFRTFANMNIQIKLVNLILRASAYLLLLIKQYFKIMFYPREKRIKNAIKPTEFGGGQRIIEDHMDHIEINYLVKEVFF